MPSHRLTVSVPQPCHEEWHAMTPQNQGRFCQSCAKTVVDFTAMSDVEIIAWLEKSSGRVCGSFNSHQLGKEFTLASAFPRKWNWRAITLGISAWLSLKTAEAKEIRTVLPVEQYQAPTISSLLPTQENTQAGIDSLKIVKGIVLTSDSETPMPGVTVMWKETTIAAAADREGKFTISIPDHIPESKLTLVISYIGFSPQEINLKALPNHDNIIVRLTPDLRVMGEVIVTGMDSPRPQYKSAPAEPRKTGFFQKLKKFFS